MTIAPDISTDLVTPLGAYVQLRREGRAAFLLESVERGRLGRHSLVGCGSRLCYLAEAEACGEPVVGYLAYDYAARLEPTVHLPEDGTGLPESRFLVADVLIRFDHALGSAEVIRGDAGAVSSLLAQPVPDLPSSEGTRRTRATHSGPDGLRDIRFARPRRHPRGRRVPDRALATSGATDVGLGAGVVPRVAPVNPSPYLFLLELGRPCFDRVVAGTLVKCEGRRAGVNPIAGRPSAARVTQSASSHPRRTALST